LSRSRSEKIQNDSPSQKTVLMYESDGSRAFTRMEQRLSRLCRDSERREERVKGGEEHDRSVGQLTTALPNQRALQIRR